MRERLARLLYGRRCPICADRFRDLATHQLSEHTDAEITRWMEGRR